MSRSRRNIRPVGGERGDRSGLTDRLGAWAWVGLVGLVLLAGVAVGVGIWAGSASAGQAERAPTKHTVMLGGVEHELRLALDSDTRTRGLMFVRELGPNEGMLFIFPDEEVRSFWMKNCLIGLDIIFIDGDGKIVSIHTLPPPAPGASEREIPQAYSAGPSRYAIELSAGSAAGLGLEIGDELELSVERLKRWVR